MRILVNFMQRDGWSVHCIAEDARTPISPFVDVKELPTMIRLLRYVGASDKEIAEIEDRVSKWNRGSVRINLAPGRKNLLRIRAPWSKSLSV